MFVELENEDETAQRIQKKEKELYTPTPPNKIGLEKLFLSRQVLLEISLYLIHAQVIRRAFY